MPQFVCMKGNYEVYVKDDLSIGLLQFVMMGYM